MWRHQKHHGNLKWNCSQILPSSDIFINNQQMSVRFFIPLPGKLNITVGRFLSHRVLVLDIYKCLNSRKRFCHFEYLMARGSRFLKWWNDTWCHSETMSTFTELFCISRATHFQKHISKMLEYVHELYLNYACLIRPCGATKPRMAAPQPAKWSIFRKLPLPTQFNQNGWM